MATIVLTVAYDEQNETLTDVLHELVQDLDVTFDDTGVRTSGGFPDIEFGGPVGDLEVLVNRYNGDNGFEQFAELLTLIKA